MTDISREIDNQKEEEQLPPHRVYVGSEAETIETLHQEKIKLPPLPEGVLLWTDDEKKVLEFPIDKLDKDDKFVRVKFKLFNIWNIWGSIRNNEKLIDIINKIPDDKTTDEFYLREAIVSLVDGLGKALNGGTDIMVEFS